jgi:hypothetical protein
MSRLCSLDLISLTGNRFSVTATARSEEKGRIIVESVEPEYRSLLSFVVVDDVARDGAYENVG